MLYALLQPIVRSVTNRIGTLDGVDHLPHGPFIVAANHISYVEPSAIVMVVTRNTGQKVFSPTQWGVYSFFHRLGLAGYFGMLPVRRDQPALVLDHARRRLNEGNPILIFPEAKRIFTKELGKGKTGVARLAHWTGLPVVPVGYQGLAAHSVLSSIVALITRPQNITMRIGKPLTFSKTESPTGEQLTDTTTTIMRAIGALCDRPYEP